MKIALALALILATSPAIPQAQAVATHRDHKRLKRFGIAVAAAGVGFALRSVARGSAGGPGHIKGGPVYPVTPQR